MQKALTSAHSVSLGPVANTIYTSSNSNSPSSPKESGAVCTMCEIDRLLSPPTRDTDVDEQVSRKPEVETDQCILKVCDNGVSCSERDLWQSHTTLWQEILVCIRLLIDSSTAKFKPLPKLYIYIATL